MKLRALVTTFLKQSTLDSSVLQKHPKNLFKLEAGKEIEIGEFSNVENHLKIKTVDAVQDKYTWYVFAPHVELRNTYTNALIVINNPDKNTAPKVDRTELEKLPPEPLNVTSKKLVNILGKQINLYDSIIPNGSFTWDEATHRGTRLPQQQSHVDGIIAIAKLVQRARDEINKPFQVTSWYRPEPHNSRAGGVSNSQHLYGNAMDVYVEGETGRSLARKLSWWPGGLGIYTHLPEIIHLDARAGISRWGL